VVGAVEVGLQAATTDLSETETMVTTEIAVTGSTVGEAMAEEAISRDTIPNRPPKSDSQTC
jgi:hypothetical protein